MQIDPSTPFGERVTRRLRDEQIGWLTTVGHDGTPQPSPIWFLWDGETLLIYSQPDTPKLRNIERRARVSLHLDGDGQGGDIIVLTGEARIAGDIPPGDQVPPYVEKYQAGIESLGMTPEAFASAYSVPIVVTPTKLRGH